jgi:hypothetical protein
MAVDHVEGLLLQPPRLDGRHVHVPQVHVGLHVHEIQLLIPLPLPVLVLILIQPRRLAASDERKKK